MPEERYQDSHLYKIRHSAAHIMAEAVLEAYPEAKIAIGPPIEDGFYYDFELPESIGDADLKKIEKRMRKIASGVHEFTVRDVTPDEAREIFADQPYKLELIDDLVNGRVDENGEQIAEPAEKLTIYTQDSFTDLCRGPHVASTKEINPKAMSITFRPPAGAYWRGNENNKMLTRIYGTAWETPEELKDYLERLEEAKRRDHRVLGDKLELFVIDPLVGKGLPLWLPKGAILRDTLERWLRQQLIEGGYEPVVTPHIGSIELYKTSGHYPYYSDSQYTPIDVDGEEFLLKPMNCPHHIMMYKSKPRSYRDLPVRFAEFGTVYRYEKSGQLNGLTRVRGFTQDDAHLFVTEEQLLPEYIETVRFAQNVLSALNIMDFRARVGIRDPQSDKYVGDDANWEVAAQAIIDACEEIGLPYTVEEGEAAFYGPKLDIVVNDVLKREWQLGTVQVDYNLPERFELEYVDNDNERKRPIMIHRALFGSVERFVGILIEHFAGEFPVWLAPTQAVIIPIRDHHNAYAKEIEGKLKAQGFRVESDLRDRNMRNKIKEHRKMLVPYLLIVGDRDMEDGTVSVRLRTDEDLGAMPLDQFSQMVSELAKTHSMDLTLASVAGD
ncbi:MAG: threonine--tRNA ligase [Anaerolineaceae bacterium]|nr:threonine--tRNA ligase [Anaerolineaceae bacterium]